MTRAAGQWSDDDRREVRKLFEELAYLDRERDQAAALFDRLTWQQRRALSRFGYTCPKGCVIFVVWMSGGTLWYWKPDYKNSPGRNARVSTPEGRARNSIDGDRRWPGWVDSADNLCVGGVLELHCPHYLEQRMITEDLRREMSRGEPGDALRRVV